MAERKDARRRRILEAAIEMFGRLGYHATTVPAIVAEAGSSIGSFYFYFRNKEDVFAAALLDLGDRLAQSLNSAISAESQPLFQMRAAVMRLFQFLAENPREARILVIESSGLDGRLQEIRRNIVASHARGVEAALTKLAPVLPSLNAVVAARCWVGSVFEAVYHWLELPLNARPPADEVASAVALYNLRAIGASVESPPGLVR